MNADGGKDESAGRKLYEDKGNESRESKPGSGLFLRYLHSLGVKTPSECQEQKGLGTEDNEGPGLAPSAMVAADVSPL
jgi:hypothetical protein